MPPRAASMIGSPRVGTTARRKSPLASGRFARSWRCTAPAGSRSRGPATWRTARWNTSGATIIRAGFRRQDQDENWEYFVLPEAWRGELCKGLDPAAIAKAMIAKGWMQTGEGKHLARQVRVPGIGKTRLYCITSSFLAGEGAVKLALRWRAAGAVPTCTHQ